MSVEDDIAEACTITGLSPNEIRDLASQPENLRKLSLTVYGDQDWAQPSTPAGTRVLALLAAIGCVAGAVSGVAGAASGVAGAVTALRSMK